MLWAALSSALSRFSCVSTATGTLAAVLLAGAAPQAAAADPYIWTGAESSIWDTSALNWTLGGAPAAFTSGGAVTFANAKNKTVSIAGNLTAGAMLVNGAYTFGGSGTVKVSSLNGAANMKVLSGLTITSSGTTTVAGGATFSSQGEGTLNLTTIKAAGQVTLGGNANITGNSGNTSGLCMHAGAAVSIIDGTTSVSGSVYMGQTDSSDTQGSTTLTVGTGSTAAKLVANRIESGDFQSGGTEDILVNRGATFVILGSDNGSGYKSASIVLSEWGAESTLTVNGAFLAKDAEVRSGDKVAKVRVGKGGVMAVKGFSTISGKKITDVMFEDGAKLVLGSTGITQGGDPFSIQSIEVGLSAATTTISTALKLDGAVTFNTNQYEWAADKQSISQGSTAGTFNISGALSGGGNITVIGSGTLSLTAPATFNGGITVDGATFKVSGSGSIGTGMGMIRVKSGTFSSEKNLDLSSRHVMVDKGGKLTVKSGTELTLGPTTLGESIQNAGNVIFVNTGKVITDNLEVKYAAQGYVDETGAASDQGFLQGTTQYVQVVEGGTSESRGATFSYQGQALVYDAATGRATVSSSQDTDWSRYELRSGTPDFAAMVNFAAAHGGQLKTVDMSGGSLQVARDFSYGTVIVRGASTIGADSGHSIGTVDIYGTGDGALEFTQPTSVGNLVVRGSSTLNGSVKPVNFTVASGANATLSSAIDAANIAVQSGSTVTISGTGNGVTATNGSVDGSVTVDSQAAFRVGPESGQGGTIAMNGAMNILPGSTLDIRQNSALAVGGWLRLASGCNYTQNGALQVAPAGTLVAGNGIQLGALDVQGKLSLEGDSATVAAKGGPVANLDIAAGQTLDVNGSLSLQSTSGADGNLAVSGTLTAPGTLHLDNVTAGAVALTTTGALAVDNELNTASISLARLNTATPYVYAGSLTAGNTDFRVSVDAVENLRLNDGDILTLADVDSILSGTVSVNGGEFIAKQDSDYAYTISQDTATNDIILTAREKESEYIWLGDSDIWEENSNWSGGAAPDSKAWVQLRADRHEAGSIVIDGSESVARMTSYHDTDHTLTGDGSLNVAGRMDIQNSALQIGSGSDALSVQSGSTRLVKGGSLRVNEGASYATGSLTGDATTTVAGNITVFGNGGVYSGTYGTTHITMERRAGSPGTINQALAPDSALTVDGSAGSLVLLYGTNSHLGGLNTTQMSVVLNSQTDDAVGKQLTVDSPAAVTNGQLVFGLDPESTAATLGTKKAPHVITTTGGLDLSGSQLVIGQGGSYSKNALVIDTDGQTEGLALAYVGDEATQASGVSLVGKLFNKYYTNARLVNGAVLVDLRSGYFAQDVIPGGDHNVRTGANMLDEVLKYTNPQVTDPKGELAGIMDALESGKLARGQAERIAASLAGASSAALGLAASADVDRQLRAIRNRTTVMGVGEGADNKGMPYLNAWVNAEGDYRKLSADGSLAGYKMTSWGGTLGLDVDCTPRFTCGLAVTAMYGDFTGNSAEAADGDLDRTYLTAFAHYTRGAWNHTLVGTIGRFDTKLRRSINYGPNSAVTNGDTDGTGFGLMYELGYTRALNESGTTAIQPLFNVSWRHSSLGGYTESGSQTALTVGDAEADVVTFALGARLQSAYGAQPCNRSALFEGRVLAKLSTGDKDIQTKVNLAGLPTHTAKSAEMGGFGMEIGAGLAIPMARDTDTLFFDLSAEFWGGYTNVNGVIGYRLNF